MTAHSSRPASGAEVGGPPPASATLLRSMGLSEEDADAGSVTLETLLADVADQLGCGREEARDLLRRTVA